ncbi:MAG: lamin tail domain-containing protein [Nanoarchaeota archaeon]|nr:lamin tail domain-containing protein [Nanoarchaeota archaeon]
MKKIILCLIMLGAIPMVSANIIITEVMFDPTQTSSQTDGEWIEIFNDGNEPVDLTDWKIDNYNFDDYVIQPGEYVVIARELVDGTDADNESFESYWGNNDGVWDENDGFAAIDGYFSFAIEDTINLTNGIITEVLYYNSSISPGDGKTIERVNYSLPNTIDNWAEGQMDGTPGRSQYSSEESSINVEAVVINVAPAILEKIFLTDDCEDEGIQIMPEIDKNKTVYVSLEVSDDNGISDIKETGVRINGREYLLLFSSEKNQSLVFNGSFEMAATDLAGDYNLEFFARDNASETSENLGFTYLGILSSVILTKNLNLAELVPGGISEEKIVEIKNTGNIEIDTIITGFDLEAEGQIIPKENIEVFNLDWMSLAQPQTLDTNAQPNEITNLRFRMKVPQFLKANTFKGKIKVTSKVG